MNLKDFSNWLTFQRDILKEEARIKLAVASFIDSAEPRYHLALGEIAKALSDGVQIDGEGHKQWALEEVARLMGVDLPEHDQGVAP